jgi:hypothetical protein
MFKRTIALIALFILTGVLCENRLSGRGPLADGAEPGGDPPVLHPVLRRRMSTGT